MSPATLATYSAAVRGLDAFLVDQAMPQAVGAIRREHVEAFITSLLERWKPATAHNRYRALRAFFGWLVEEGEILENPMTRMRPPRLPEEPPPVLRDTELRAILAACERDKTWLGRRDEAILRVFMDTGARRAEVLGLRLEDIDLDRGILSVTGKGSRTRLVAVGDATIRALDRYIRLRARRPGARRPVAVARAQGPARRDRHGRAHPGSRFSGRARGTPAPIPTAYAHSMLSAGMSEGDLMAVAGWRSREMLTRYAASTRQEQAPKSARALSPVDRLTATER
jgi:site-specific recombinase XerC